MSDADMLLKNLAGGGIGATVLGIGVMLYKTFQRRRCKSKCMSCINIEVSSPHDQQQKEEHFHIEIPVTRTPVPSINLDTTGLEKEQKENLTT